MLDWPVTPAVCVFSWVPKWPGLETLEERPAGLLNLISGGVCLDFMNTVGARSWFPEGKMNIRDEKLHDYVDLLAWPRHAGALPDAQANVLAREELSTTRMS